MSKGREAQRGQRENRPEGKDTSIARGIAKLGTKGSRRKEMGKIEAMGGVHSTEKRRKNAFMQTWIRQERN